MASLRAHASPGIRDGGIRDPAWRVASAYVPDWIAWTSASDRDRQRERLVVAGYFYHDMNGSPVGFDALAERHALNRLTMHEQKPSGAVLRQYANTAILALKMWTKGRDKGHALEGYGSAAIVRTCTPEGWKVAVDIVGQEPDPPPHPLASE